MKSPLVSFDYVPMLRQWSREVLAGDLGEQLGLREKQSDWLGASPATGEVIAETEARLGITLPPSYRQFLLTSDGWGPLSSFVHRLRPARAIDWFIVENQSAVETWSKVGDRGQPDSGYFRYAEEDANFRGEDLRHTLLISDGGDGDLLLNPRAVTPDGEWECWFLASWIPGAQRSASFAHWLLREYESFRKLAEIAGPLPAEPQIRIPSSSVARKAVKPKRARPPRRNVESLIKAMSSDDAMTRSNGTKEFAGGLRGRNRSERRPELVEPLTTLFRTSPDKDVRSLCVQMLTEAAPDGPAPVAIIEAFSDVDPFVFIAATWALHHFPINEAFDAACAFVVKTQHPFAKNAGLSALRAIADPRAIPVLARVLRDHTQTFDQLFGGAALALAACGEAGFEQLVLALDDSDPRVRFAALVGLDQFKDDERVVGHLRPLLQDENSAVRDRTTFALRMRDEL